MVTSRWDDVAASGEAMYAELGLAHAEERLAWEARAKITWGDSRDDVCTWLEGCGMSPATAAAVVSVCLRERAGAMRGKGVRDSILGGAGLAIGLLILFAGIQLAGVRQLGRLPGLVMGVGILLGMYTAYLLFRGLERLVFGAHSDGAVSDVDEWQ
jgi:hypothetical protein